MPFIEDSLMTWEECGDLIKVDIQRLDSAIRAGEEIALDDSFPIRSLLSTFNGYGPSGVDRLEDILGVTEEFRLAVCLEHSLSLVICSLVQLYYVDRNLVYELDEKWADIKAAQSMLKTLVTFVTSYQRHFEVYGPKYEEVRRGCDEIYLAWNALRARRPEVCSIPQCSFLFFLFLFLLISSN